MQRKAVTSRTGICGVGYDPATKTLELEFSSRKEGEPNRVYHYENFTQDDWAAFNAAKSLGSHFLKVIKPHFVCTRLEVKKDEEKKEIADLPPAPPPSSEEDIPW